jgi:hypothetical protein
VNGQIEYLLRRALIESGRLRAVSPPEVADQPPDPENTTE